MNILTDRRVSEVSVRNKSRIFCQSYFRSIFPSTVVIMILSRLIWLTGGKNLVVPVSDNDKQCQVLRISK